MVKHNDLGRCGCNHNTEIQLSGSASGAMSGG